MKPEQLGFPPPLLGSQPRRLPVLGLGEGWLALDKPSGVLIDAHPWHPGAPSLVAGLRSQAEAGKPELKPLAIQQVASVYFLEIDATGVALVSLNADTKAVLRNWVGSSLVTFHYRFFCRGGSPEAVLECSAPLLGNDAGSCAEVNHKRGKKSHTRFERVADYGCFSEWKAETRLPRPHQVRIHARECGLAMIGETFYGGAVSPTRGEIMGRRAGGTADKPLFEGLALRLTRVELPAEEGQTQARQIEAPAWDTAEAACRLVGRFACSEKERNSHQGTKAQRMTVE